MVYGDKRFSPESRTYYGIKRQNLITGRESLQVVADKDRRKDQWAKRAYKLTIKKNEKRY